MSEEIARVTGRDVYKEIPAAVEGSECSSGQEDEDHMLQMKAYADRLDRMSPGALSPSSASPGQHYLKTSISQQVHVCVCVCIQYCLYYPCPKTMRDVHIRCILYHSHFSPGGCWRPAV